MAYDNTNTGVLFRNDKATTDKHPTHTGSINIDGVDYWLSAWVKEGAKGKFFSMSVKLKEERVAKPAPKAPRKAEPDFDSSDVPF